MMHVTIPACVLECAMSLYDSYSKAYMLPLGAELAAPHAWALLYGTLGALTIYDFHLLSPMEDETALRTFLDSEAEGNEGLAHPLTPSPLLALVSSCLGKPS